MIRVYRFLLKLYPRLDREKFGDEMLDVFSLAEAEAGCRSALERAAFYVRETVGLVAGGLRERVRGVGSCAGPGQEINMGGTMILETRCRFPRSSIAIMTFVLVITVGMIAKIQGVSHFYGKIITGELPRQPLHWPSYYGLVSGIVVCFLAAWIVGGAVWAVAYAMRRTAAQQLGNFEAWPRSRS